MWAANYEWASYYYGGAYFYQPHSGGSGAPPPSQASQAYQTLLHFQRDVSRILGSETCAKLFGNDASRASLSPSRVLQALIGHETINGRRLVLDFDRPDSAMGPAQVTEAGGVIRVSVKASHWMINHSAANNSRDNWGRDQNALLLIHELGHVFDLLPGTGGSVLYTPDANLVDSRRSEWNSWKVDQECFGGKLGYARPPGM
jgi:hypothetical protein